MVTHLQIICENLLRITEFYIYKGASPFSPCSELSSQRGQALWKESLNDTISLG